jgi:hypothetical protein
LYGYETQSVTSREEHSRLRTFENRVLRKIFGPKRNELPGDWRRLHNDELHALYSSPNIIRMVKLRIMRVVGHMACMGKRRRAYRGLTGNLRERNHLEDPDVDIRMILK